jgi:hypothetical protein
MLYAGRGFVHGAVKTVAFQIAASRRTRRLPTRTRGLAFPSTPFAGLVAGFAATNGSTHWGTARSITVDRLVAPSAALSHPLCRFASIRSTTRLATALEDIRAVLVGSEAFMIASPQPMVICREIWWPKAPGVSRRWQGIRKPRGCTQVTAAATTRQPWHGTCCSLNRAVSLEG